LNYILYYVDKTNNETIIVPLEADTDKKAINKVNEILKDKKYSSPALYDDGMCQWKNCKVSEIDDREMDECSFNNDCENCEMNTKGIATINIMISSTFENNAKEEK